MAFEASDVILNRAKDPLLQEFPALDLGPDWTETFGQYFEGGVSLRV